MIRRLASLSILALCLFSLSACIVAPVGPGSAWPLDPRPLQRLALDAGTLGLIAWALIAWA